MHDRSSTGHGDLVANLVAGIAGGLVASWAMEHFQRSLERASKNGGGAPGGGGQQHRTPESEPATYKAAEAVTRSVTGEPLSDEAKPAAGALVHYAFGAAVGAAYGAAAARSRDVTAWNGLPFGATVWLVADEVGVPLAGLSRTPAEYPMASHASALATHLVYGFTTETVRKILVGLMRN